jgi:uncharacterized protein YjbI with pentapeptide repeats
MLPPIVSVGASCAAAHQTVSPPLRERLLQLARQAGIEPDEHQLSVLTDMAAWMACVWRNMAPGPRETVDIVRLPEEFSLARAPLTWHATCAANVIANLLGVSVGASHGDSVRQLTLGMESAVLSNPDETWAELERVQHPVVSLDRHSAARDWPASILRVALPMRRLKGADLSADAARNPDLLADLDLSGVDLGGINLSGMNLDTVGLRKTDLSNANLAAAKLRGADLSGADLSYTGLENANLTGAILDGVWSIGANFAGARMEGVRYSLAPSLLAALAEMRSNRCDAMLLSIGSIDDAYRELKRDLAASLVEALADAPDSRNAELVRDFMAGRSSIFGDNMPR